MEICSVLSSPAFSLIGNQDGVVIIAAEVFSSDSEIIGRSLDGLNIAFTSYRRLLSAISERRNKQSKNKARTTFFKLDGIRR
jgi:hypothetical protein